MKHFNHYIKLIRNAQQRGNGVEGHHIFPRALFGDNDGVVMLTMREHYVAHKLLFHVCKSRYGNHPNTYKMANAVMMMGNRSSRHYEVARNYFTDNHHTKTKGGRAAISERMKGNQHLIGKTLGPMSENHKRSISEAKNKSYEVAFTNGQVCDIVGLTNWARERGYNPSHLIQIAKGKRQRHKNIIGVTKLD